MKFYLAFCLLVSTFCLLLSTAAAVPVLSFPPIPAPRQATAPASVSGTGAAPSTKTTAQKGATKATKKGYVNPYGPKAYGPGLNNRYALAPNPYVMQRALALANSRPGILVRVEVDGEVTLTDYYGREIDAFYDNHGFDLLELYDL